MSTQLIYMLIGMGIGIVLGINIFLLYNRFFNPRSQREQKLRSQIKGLEKKLKKKDYHISKAIKSVKNRKEGQQ